MDIVIRNIEGISHFTNDDNETKYSVELEEKWYLKKDEILFKTAILFALNDNVKRLGIEDILPYYLPNLISINKVREYILRKIQVKLSAIALIFSVALSLLCFVGQIFLYGYYYTGGMNGFTGLLSIIINPIPINIFSSALVGIYIFIISFFVYITGKHHLSDDPSSLRRLFISFISTLLIAIINTIIFTSLRGKSVVAMGFLLFLNAILPVMLFSLFEYLKNVMDRPLCYIASFVIYTALLVVITLLLQKNDVELESVAAYIATLYFAGVNLTYNLLNNVFSRKKKKEVMDQKIKNLCVQNFLEWKNRIKSQLIITGGFYVFGVLMSFAIIYSLGTLYGEMPSSRQYSLIKYSQFSNEPTTVVGTIIGEKPNSIYISTRKSKDLIFLKDAKVEIQTCDPLITGITNKEFANSYDVFNEFINKEKQYNCLIEFIDNSKDRSNDTMNLFNIIDEDKKYSFKVYYGTAVYDYVGKILIEGTKYSDDAADVEEYSEIKKFLLDHFSLFDIYDSLESYYYSNGEFMYSYEELDDGSNIQTYYFNSYDN